MWNSSRGLLIVLLAAAVAQAFGRFTYALVLPSIERSLGSGYTVAGALGASNLAAYAVGTIVVIVASTRFAPTTLVRAGLAFSTAGLTMLSITDDLGLLFVAMVLTGLGGAGVWINAPGLASSFVSPHRRGLGIGLAGTGIGLGIAFAGWLVVQTGEAEWHAVYRTEAIVAAATLALAIVALPSSPRRGWRRPRMAAITDVISWKPLMASYAAYGLAMSLFVNFLVARLNTDADFSAEAAAAVFAAFGIATIFGGPILGSASDRWSRRGALIAGFGAMTAACLAVLTSSPPVVLAAAISFGLAFSGIPTVVAAQVADHVSPESFGAAFGALTLGFSVAQVGGPQIGGVIGDAMGSFTWVFVGSALVASVGVIAAIRIHDHRP